MSKIWFTSDLHFGHKNIVQYTDRGVVTSKELHDEWLIDLWNSIVDKSDIVYHLGDLSFYKDARKTVEILEKLNGQKFLIKGNHDHSENFASYAQVKNVVKTAIYLEKDFVIGDTKQRVIMFHFPIGSWHKQSHGSWHLHGHSHGGYKDAKGKMLDVGIDNAYNVTGRHQFFDLQMITDWMNTQQRYTADIHRKEL